MSSRLPVFKTLARILCGMLVVYLVAGMAEADADGEGEARWFHLLEEGEQFWEIQNKTVESDRFMIIPKNRKITSYFRSVLVLLDTPSTSYEISTDTILAEFRARGIDATFTVLRTSALVQSPDRIKKFLDQAGGKAGFDLIFSMGSVATSIMVEHYRQPDSPKVNPGSPLIPVVSVASPDPVLMGWVSSYTGGSRTNLAFTSASVPVDVQLAYLHDFNENLRTIAVVYDPGDKTIVKAEVEPLLALAREKDIRVLEVAIRTDGLAREELVRKIPPIVRDIREHDPEVENSIFWVTTSDALLDQMKALYTVTDRVPVLSSAHNAVRAGNEESAIISIGITPKSNARLAASYAIAILMDEAQVGSLDVGQVSPPDIAINFRSAGMIGLKIPFLFFESSRYVYNLKGVQVMDMGQSLLLDTTGLH